MTTLAIVGGGIVGRSLLYNLTVQDFPFDEILFFENDSFAPACSLRSTAMVATRGVTRGHSPLGDLIVEGLACFEEHAKRDLPDGVWPVTQYTGALSRSEEFKKRYPGARSVLSLQGLPLPQETLFIEERAHLVAPEIYLPWLLAESKKKLPIKEIKGFVTDCQVKDEKVTLMAHEGVAYVVDHAVFAAGAQSRFWKGKFPDTKLATSKPVHGAYLEFMDVKWELPSFSVSLDGHNLIYRSHNQSLLVGSTTSQGALALADMKELKGIYYFMREHLPYSLPPLERGSVRVGVREKAQKREPYFFTDGRVSFIGGFYKNGFILGLKMTKTLAHQLQGPF